eukprot:6175991-Pleurochrysis_carterae.AAC.1
MAQMEQVRHFETSGDSHVGYCVTIGIGGLTVELEKALSNSRRSRFLALNAPKPAAVDMAPYASLSYAVPLFTPA